MSCLLTIGDVRIIISHSLDCLFIIPFVSINKHFTILFVIYVFSSIYLVLFLKDYDIWGVLFPLRNQKFIILSLSQQKRKSWIIMKIIRFLNPPDSWGCRLLSEPNARVENLSKENGRGFEDREESCGEVWENVENNGIKMSKIYYTHGTIHQKEHH